MRVPFQNDSITVHVDFTTRKYKSCLPLVKIFMKHRFRSSVILINTITNREKSGSCVLVHDSDHDMYKCPSPFHFIPFYFYIAIALFTFISYYT